MDFRHGLAACVVMVALASSPTALAAPPEATLPPEPAVTFDGGIATVFPVMVAGAQGILEMPHRLQLRAEVGWLGTPYVEAIDGFLLGIGAYGEGAQADATSELIRAGIQNSLTLRTSVGWRPFDERGFEIHAGYTMNALGGRLSGKATIESLLDITFPTDLDALNVDLSSTLHSFHLGVGWRWFVGDALVVRSSVEYLQTVASRTELTLDGPRRERDVPEEIVGPTNAYLDGVYRTYVKAPAVSLSVAYRF